MHSDQVEPEEVWDQHFEDQLPPANYLRRQLELNAIRRSSVVTWYVRLRKHLNLSDDILYKTVNTFDRFMALNPIRHGNLPCVAAGALATALGVDGRRWEDVQDIIGLFDHAEVREAKRKILQQLEDKILPIAPTMFLDQLNKIDSSEQAPKVLAQYFVEAALYDERFIGKGPNLIAAASYCLARELLGKGPWSSQYIQSVHYTKSALEEPITALLEICQNPKERHPKTWKRFNKQHAAILTEMEKGLQELKSNNSTMVHLAKDTTMNSIPLSVPSS